MHDTAERAADDGGLTALREAVRAAASGCDDADARRQHHPELSPLAWHLGHTFLVETYWLRSVVCGNDHAIQDWRELFFPEYNSKSGRAQRLPPLQDILDWTRSLEAGNRAYWAQAESGMHPLMRDGYLTAFLVQHYAQHLETMALIHRQRALTRPTHARVAALTEAVAPGTPDIRVAGGRVRMGTDHHHAYDNEQPAHERELPSFHIASRAVTNAEWLAFLDDGGYARRSLWSAAGWRWLSATGVRAPQHWRAHPDGGWYCPDPDEALSAQAPVHGICAHEADAFAAWVGARLPHEHEWELAVRCGAINANCRVWTWCANALYPYPGFRAFPYQGYSMPWFDGGHRVLRGGCRHTRDVVQRPGFRNFYPESHRHVCAGLRLAG